jgi:hypothetical protein
MPEERNTTGVEAIGFGFEPTPQGAHHFVVNIPRSDDGNVTVFEHFVYGEEVEVAAARARFSQEHDGRPAIRQPQPKVELSKRKFEMVAEEVRTEFNRHLRKRGLKASSWKPGENRLAPYLGKELVLLLWAIEEIDPSSVPNSLANWQGLAPEERWWLYTTINAATGHASEGRGKGWRRAIGIAFEGNPISHAPYFSRNTLPIRSNGTTTDSNQVAGRKRRKKQDEELQLPFVGIDTAPSDDQE